jgi:hypothetical protein
MTLPRLGLLGAQALYAALADWWLFADGDRAARGVGLLLVRVVDSKEKSTLARVVK